MNEGCEFVWTRSCCVRSRMYRILTQKAVSAIVNRLLLAHQSNINAQYGLYSLIFIIALHLIFLLASYQAYKIIKIFGLFYKV